MTTSILICTNPNSLHKGALSTLVLSCVLFLFIVMFIAILYFIPQVTQSKMTNGIIGIVIALLSIGNTASTLIMDIKDIKANVKVPPKRSKYRCEEGTVHEIKTMTTAMNAISWIAIFLAIYVSFSSFDTFKLPYPEYVFKTLLMYLLFYSIAMIAMSSVVLSKIKK